MPLKTLFCILFTGFGLSVYAQNDADVQRYSSDFYFGTARFNGLGGAMGALGGDMSAVHLNPAGLGLFRFGTVSFTPAMESNTIMSDLGGNTLNENVTLPVINNTGLVLVNEITHPYWRSFNFGISYNRVNTFNDKLRVNSTLPANRSMMQDFAREATGFSPDQLSDFSAGLAYDGYIIDPDTLSPGNLYYPHVGDGDISQRQSAERQGRIGETSLNFAGNYDDRIYIGASINFQSVAYKSTIETMESPVDPQKTDLINYAFREELETKGLGVNLKVGAIVKAGKIFRVGGSVQTPTTFSLTDNFQNSIDSKFRDPQERFTYSSPLGIFEYRIRTPWRFMGSVAAVIKDKGLISVQYEFSDFSSGKIKKASSGEYDADFSNTNAIVANSYTAMNILRVGAEYRLTKSFYARAGFAWFSNPNKANEFGGVKLDRLQYGGGIGFRKAIWNIDLSYQLATKEEQYLINYSGINGKLLDHYSNIALTVGIRL